MPNVRKSIMLAEQDDAYIKEQVESGDFASESEYLRALIRRDQARNISEIRIALAEGEQSGEPRQVDPAEFKQRMVEKISQRGGA